jgi:hypothetical protein
MNIAMMLAKSAKGGVSEEKKNATALSPMEAKKAAVKRLMSAMKGEDVEAVMTAMDDLEVISEACEEMESESEGE